MEVTKHFLSDALLILEFTVGIVGKLDVENSTHTHTQSVVWNSMSV